MLLVNKSLPYETLDKQLVCGTSTFMKGVVRGSDKLVPFHVLNKSVVDRAFYNFAVTPGACNGSVTGWVCCIFARFCYRSASVSAPSWCCRSMLPNAILHPPSTLFSASSVMTTSSAAASIVMSVYCLLTTSGY